MNVFCHDPVVWVTLTLYSLMVHIVDYGMRSSPLMSERESGEEQACKVVLARTFM